MKKILVLFFVLAAFLITNSFASDEKKLNEKLKTPSGKMSYYLGTQIGSSLKNIQEKIGFDDAVFMKGLLDVLKGKKLLLSKKELDAAQKEFINVNKLRSQQNIKGKSKMNKEKGEAFLAENSKKEGVIVTDSGLQYKILTKGDGAKPKATDKVTVHYKGTLIDGTEFDSSYSRGEPIAFPLNGVIAGWTEGVQLMNIGSKYEFYIPSNLAYGERGAGGVIGPNETLIFIVELLGIN